jgi:phosphoglycerate dehydrogenase-like enzyme
MPAVLVTTDYLRPGDEVDAYLTGLGYQTRHDPMLARRDPERLVDLLEGVEGALVANEPLTAHVLERAPTLRAVVRTGVGYDSIDVTAATRLGISVSNLPGINSNAVAEYTIGLLLASARHLTASAAGVAAGAWPRRDGHELFGKTLGVIGFGASGRRVAALADAFGMRVLCVSNVPEHLRAGTPARFVGLHELLRESDFVSIHTALTPQTHHLIDTAALAKMKPTAYLINTARGGIVDENALAEAVQGGRLAGAALDVVQVEPLPVDSVLRTVEAITVYSHMAGQTAEARREAGLAGARELVAALSGHPASSVNTLRRTT